MFVVIIELFASVIPARGHHCVDRFLDQLDAIKM